MKRYKLAIFDWDGTIMDSQQYIVATLAKVIADLGYVPKTNNELKNVIGLGLTQAIYGLYPDLDDKQNQKFADLYRNTFLSSSQAPPVLFKGVKEMILDLESTGVMLAVATGKSRQGLQHSIIDSGLNKYFHASRCADETCSKPNPQMLEELLDEFSLSADDAVMIGDTEYDMEMAQNIKMDAIAVSYGVHEEHRLAKFNPISICQQVSDLARELNQCVVSY